jgi:TRAP transporter TAXI family solute receptor
MDYYDTKPPFFAPQYQAIGNSSEAISNGLLDAAFDTQLPPASAHTNIMATGQAKLINYTQSQIDTILKAQPILEATIIKANTYPNQTTDIHTVGFCTHLTARSDFDEELAYQITKTLMEHMKDLYEIYQHLMVTSQNPMQGTAIPIHAGAARYYKEVGLTVPTNTIRK